MTNTDVDLAYQDLYEVIPELRGERNMNRASTMSDYGYYETNLLQRHDSMGNRTSLYESPVHQQNLSEWVKTSIMGDLNQMNFDYVPNLSGNGHRGTQGDLQGQELLYKTQQIAQSRSFDDCTCSAYSSDVPHCTCGVQNDHLKTSVEQDAFSMSMKQNFKATQDAWQREMTDSEYNRLQKEKHLQSFAVPDPSTEYPYYLNYHDETSIYDQDIPQALPLLNTIPEKAAAFSAYLQRVPKSNEIGYNVPSPITSPGPKPMKSSRPRLCHFLLELLANPQQYSDIVEWVDKEKGVFKFLNSAEVASQWGRRRNKPHMKYENFARSLRTYIAKGILTKPRSKLVYRFTNKVY